MNDKVMEKLIEAMCVAIVSGTLWWIVKALQTYTDSKVRSRDIARDMAHIKRSQDALSLAIANMDQRFEEFGDKLFELDKKVLLVDAQVRFGRNSKVGQLPINSEEN